MLIRASEWLNRLRPERRQLAGRLNSLDPTALAELRSLRALAVQHYIRNDDEPFKVEVARTRLRARDLPENARARWEYLLDALDANAHGKDKKFDDAEKLYARAIGAVQSLRSSHERRLEVEGRFDFYSNLLALLHTNLAETLAASGRAPAKVEDQYKVAIDCARRAPRMCMPYICNAYGSYCVEHELLDTAADAFRQAALAAPNVHAHARLQSKLTHVETKRAGRLADSNNFTGALDVLRRARRDVDAEIQALDALPASSDDSVKKERVQTREELSSWTARTEYLVGEILERSNQIEQALEPYRRSADGYATVQNYTSASYVSERCGNCLVTLGRDQEALAAYEASLGTAGKIAELDAQRITRARLLAKRAGLLLIAGRRDDADAVIDECRTVWQEGDYRYDYSKIAADMALLPARPEALAFLRGRYDALLRQTASREDRRELVYGLRRLFSSAAADVTLAIDGHSALNVMTPIQVEIEDTTWVAIGGSEETLLQHSKAMRERVTAETGVKIPGTRWRSTLQSAGAVAGEYTLFIHEVRRASGPVNPGEVFYPGPREPLDRAGIETARAERQWNAPEGFWIARRDADQTPLSTLSCFEFITRHLELVVKANLVEIVAHQEVQNLLETHQIVTADRPLDIIAKEAGEHMDALSRIIRALVADRVPLASDHDPKLTFAAIYQVFESMWKDGAEAGAIIDAIRMIPAVRSRLWGNNDAFEFFRLGDDFEATIEGATRDPLAHVMVLDRDRAEHLLLDVRRAVQERKRVALLASRRRRRALVRQLIQSQFPEVPVLSLAELRPGLISRVVGTIGSTAPLEPYGRDELAAT